MAQRTTQQHGVSCSTVSWPLESRVFGQQEESVRRCQDRRRRCGRNTSQPCRRCVRVRSIRTAQGKRRDERLLCFLPHHHKCKPKCLLPRSLHGRPLGLGSVAALPIRPQLTARPSDYLHDVSKSNHPCSTTLHRFCLSIQVPDQRLPRRGCPATSGQAKDGIRTGRQVRTRLYDAAGILS